MKKNGQRAVDQKKEIKTKTKVNEAGTEKQQEL